MKKPLKSFGPATQVESSDAETRRHLFKGAGMFFGAGALAALATPAAARSDDEGPNNIVGLWAVVVSAADKSFPPFRALELWGDGTYIGSGQGDLSPASMESSAWGRWTKVGDNKFRTIARFWTYDPKANPTGFATFDFTYTLNADGNQYHGVGPLQFFDNNGHSLGAPTTTFDDGVRIA